MLSQPSTSTQMTEYLPPEALAAAVVPRPAPPATGMMMSAPWATSASETFLPSSCLAKSLVKEPFWVALSQPSTWTFLPLALL